MRFAAITTVVVAVVMAPAMMNAAGPRMSNVEFVSAVRCEALAGLTDGADAQGRVARLRLNGEALKQDDTTVARAQSEVRDIYAHAGASELGELRDERNVACGRSSALIANSALAPDAV